MKTPIFEGIFRMIINELYAIQPEALNMVLAAYAHRAGTQSDPPRLLSASGARRSDRRAVGGDNVAVLYVRGLVERETTWLGAILGGTAVVDIKAAIDQYMASAVDCLILDIDSPGGSVYGVHELAEYIYAAGRKKPIIAYTGGLAASAAYWIGSAAGSFVSERSAETGSIGVLLVHFDESQALESAGIKPSVIRRPEHKAEGIAIEPLSDSARDYLQGRIDDYYSLFVGDVARYRNVSVGTVESKFGGGRVLGAKAAKAVGMIDEIGSIQSHIATAITRHGEQRKRAYAQTLQRMRDLDALRKTPKTKTQLAAELYLLKNR